MRSKIKAFVPFVILLCLLMAFQVEASVRMNKTSAVLLKGKTVTLKMLGTKEKVKWSSSNKSVASVTKKGKVTGKKKGTATITAKVGYLNYVCFVRVESPSISKRKATLKVGGSLPLMMKGTGSKVKWKSSKPAVAKVSKTGLVTAKKVGTTTITATSPAPTSPWARPRTTRPRLT